MPLKGVRVPGGVPVLPLPLRLRGAVPRAPARAPPPLVLLHRPHQLLDVPQHDLRLLPRARRRRRLCRLLRPPPRLPPPERRLDALNRAQVREVQLLSVHARHAMRDLEVHRVRVPDVRARRALLLQPLLRGEPLAHLANLQNRLHLDGELLDVDPHRARGDRLEHVLVVHVVALDLQVEVLLEPQQTEPRDLRAAHAQRRRRELDERRDARDRNKPGGSRVDFAPRDGKGGDVVVRHRDALLLLAVAEVIEHDRDEQVERHEGTEHDERDEVRGRARDAAARARGAVLRRVAVGLLLRDHRVVHDAVPRLAGDHPEQDEQRVAEVGEVGVLVEVLAERHLAEQVHAQHCVHEAQQEKQRADVDQTGERDDERVEEHQKPLQFAHQTEDAR
mmetsp:Transcript_6978/g.28669  ORF Transcript_6978/g.28669 Transcript_6978/m.28669 type:complete len:391 (-) Transcript_6978:4654-5826(-)